MILLITDATNFPEVDYKVVQMQSNVEWEDCAHTAYNINDGAGIEVGRVTAVCFPYTIEDGILYGNERSRSNP